MKFGTLYSYWGNEWECNYGETAKKIADAGFDIIEVGAGHLLTMSEDDLAALKAAAEDLHLTITCNIGPPKDKDVASKDPEVRKAGIQFLSDIMEAMVKIDSHTLVGVQNTYWPNDFSDLDKPAIWQRGVESVKELALVAEKCQVTMGLEVVNRFESHILNTCEEALRFCEQVDHPNVKILLDTFHMNIEEDNIADAIRACGSMLVELHVGEGNRKLPGEGSLPWGEIGQALRDIHFDGYVVMEPFYFDGGQIGKEIKVWRDLSNGASKEEMDQKIARSVQFLRSEFLKTDDPKIDASKESDLHA